MIAEDIDGYMTHEELDDLRRHAAQAQVVVEIGCWHGRSTHALAETCPGVVHTVDWFLGTPDDPTQEYRVREAATNGEGQLALKAFLANLKPFLGVGDVCLWHMKSTRMARIWNHLTPIDLLFIDGSHDTLSVLADLDAWLPFVKSGGVVLLHDRDYPSVQAAVAQRLPGSLQNLSGTLWKWVKDAVPG